MPLSPLPSSSSSSSVSSQLSSSSPSPAKEKLSPAERKRQLAELVAELESKMSAIKQEAKAAKAASDARKRLDEHREEFDARVSFRARNTKPLFRWLHLVWAWNSEAFKDKESERLIAAVRRRDRRIDARAGKREAEILKEWGRKKKLLKGMSGLPTHLGR